VIDGVVLRRVRPEDADAIAEIYAHNVRHGTASFDTVPRSEAETLERIASCISKGWPFLVAERKGEVLGYCYATPFRERPAYANTCENSIYVRQDCVGQGIGKTLLAALVLESTQFGFRQMIAVVGGAEPASVGLHQSLGFREAGRMRSVGRKFGKWLDTVYLQLALGAGDSLPPVREP
jgi:L-amino acid N-acyltransferase YncA